MPTIVQALGLQSSSRVPLELRHSALREQHLLLVLDNARAGGSDSTTPH
jgi:hypothetical protein